ncbi:hypothetical protein GUITHDRAFT_106080 [Guillardia theta CCMP2712]|uniref:Uncharacterized protein n=2 Tax=Guillardia theta TaxID=55529 RepID=L1JIS6_GUITC|nr:hypothetical protein GUITHDRAFT_106080 [Guillardia theta CCMP2712]EKX47995.1 hypothetical protein GUITHDRAFT_106080 [Guillardia theta CCMP2712]|mmetsp:Transcript_40420/g.127217  ORF Transcript_40420/g.127217 Transcript_40420/m.127217 type:complete len:212 (+) Transcript_40420:502-1137(+)|eukprot:XP_005834975.1 hypothetical protein GUITHDRAFT_106080 [Guillardia theta CCMP2712]
MVNWCNQEELAKERESLFKQGYRLLPERPAFKTSLYDHSERVDAEVATGGELHPPGAIQTVMQGMASFLEEGQRKIALFSPTELFPPAADKHLSMRKSKVIFEKSLRRPDILRPNLTRDCLACGSEGSMTNGLCQMCGHDLASWRRRLVPIETIVPFASVKDQCEISYKVSSVKIRSPKGPREVTVPLLDSKYELPDSLECSFEEEEGLWC